jgi:ribose-phosphate pyrophosphokinase
MGDRSVCFSIASYDGFSDDLCRAANLEHGELQRQTFPDGERYARFRTPAAGRDVVIVGGTPTDADLLDLYDLATGAVTNGAARLTLVVPYFGYSTMERAVKEGEVAVAKARARLLSSIPLAPNGNRILLFDLHSEGIPYYFEGGTRAVHVYGKPVTAQAIAEAARGNPYVLACTDAGRAKWVQSLAIDLGVPASFVFKHREDASHTDITAVSAHVKGKTVVIYDDMIRTGGSLMNAAKAYVREGASRVAAVTTHGVFPADALERIRASGLFMSITCTDSHPRARELAGEFLKVDSCAPLFAPLL